VYRYLLAARVGFYIANLHPATKKREPMETKLSSKKNSKEENHIMQQISRHILVMGDPLFFLADLS
jgi:hypothetical protein